VAQGRFPVAHASGRSSRLGGNKKKFPFRKKKKEIQALPAGFTDEGRGGDDTSKKSRPPDPYYRKVSDRAKKGGRRSLAVVRRP